MQAAVMVTEELNTRAGEMMWVVQCLGPEFHPQHAGKKHGPIHTYNLSPGEESPTRIQPVRQNGRSPGSVRDSISKTKLR